MKRTAILLLVLVSFIALAGSGFAQRIARDEDGVFSTGMLTKVISVDGSNKIVIQSAATIAGSIRIRTVPEQKVSLEYFLKSKSSDRSQAIDHIDLVAVDLERIASGARLQLRAPNPPPWESDEATTIEIELSVPVNSFIEVNAIYFDLNAVGPFSGVVVPSSMGRLQVSDVTGMVDLTTANRRLTISRISGEVSAETTNSTLEARDIYSPNDQAVLRNQGGDIMIDGFDGQINARNSFGRIELIDFRPRGDRNIIRGRSAPIVIEISDMNDEQIVISNRFEDIDITVPDNLSATLSLSVGDDGKIEVGGLRFSPDLIQRDRLSLVAGSGEGSINASIRGNGNVFIRGIDLEDE